MSLHQHQYAMQAQAAKERLTTELYQLRPAVRISATGEAYITAGEAEAMRLPEWQAARLHASQCLEQWQLGPAAPVVRLHTNAAKPRSLMAVEEDVIVKALRYHAASGTTRQCVTRVARSLGIGRSTVYRRLSQMGTSVEEIIKAA